MWIANFSLDDVKKGNHVIPNNDAILIQICDPETHFPKSPYENLFVKVFQFSFLDTNFSVEPRAINDYQAEKIADALNFAKDNNLNVIVHCHAGICRSGAVAEVGTLIGFDILKNHKQPRIPNTLVFKKVRLALNIKNSWEEYYVN